MLNSQNGGSQVINTAEPIKKKSKLPIIIVAALAMVAAICVVAFLVVPTAVNNAGSKELTKAEKAWNKLGNFILYGEGKEDAIPDKLSWAEYRKVKAGGYYQIMNESGDEYIVRSLYDDYKKSISETECNEKCKALSEEMGYTFTILRNSCISDKELASWIINEGFDIASTWVSEKYSFDDELGLSPLVESYMLAELKVINIANMNGCIDYSMQIKNTCLNAISDETLEALKKDASIKRTRVENMKESVVEDLIRVFVEVEQ